MKKDEKIKYLSLKLSKMDTLKNIKMNHWDS